MQSQNIILICLKLKLSLNSKKKTRTVSVIVNTVNRKMYRHTLMASYIGAFRDF